MATLKNYQHEKRKYAGKYRTPVITKNKLFFLRINKLDIMVYLYERKC